MKKLENIVKLVEEYQYKKGITYKRTTDTFYKGLRTFYIVSFTFMAAIHILLILGMVFVKQPLESVLMQNIIISSVLYFAAFILMFLRLNLISLSLNILATVFKTTVLIPGLIMNSGVVDIDFAFYWQHLIPTLFVIIASLWMCIISTRERYLINRDYKLKISTLYENFHTDDMNDKQWNEFLQNYNG